MESFMGALMASLDSDAVWGAPETTLVANEYRKRHERRYRHRSKGRTETLDHWDNDPVVVAFSNPDMFMRMSEGAKSVDPKASATNGTSLLGSSHFLDELIASGGTPASGSSQQNHHSATDAAALEGSLTLPSLSPNARAECRKHVRELCLLRSVLQRPASAFHLVGTYNVFLARLTAGKEENGVAYLVSNIETVWYKGVKGAAGPHFSFLLELLCLYCEVLFYLSLHASQPRPRPSSSCSSSSSDDYDDDDDDGGEKRTSGGLQHVFATDGELQDRFLSLIVDLGGAVVPGVTPNVLQPRRCAVLLGCVCIGIIDSFSDDSLSKAAGLAAGKDSVLDFCLMASLPRHSLITDDAVHTTDNTARPLLVGDVSNPYTQLVVTTVCRTTVYSLDLVTVFREEGHAARLLCDAACLCIGACLEDAFHALSAQVWQHFTRDALWNAAKGITFYSWCWHRTPASVLGLLDFIDGGLKDAVHVFERDRCRRDQVRRQLLLEGGGGSGGGGAVDPQEGVRGYNGFAAGQTRKPGAAPLDALLAGALGYGDGRGYTSADDESPPINMGPDSSLGAGENRCQGRSADGEASFAVNGRRSAPDAFGFAAPQEKVLYFLSLHALTMASLAYACEEFGALAGSFLWAPPYPASELDGAEPRGQPGAAAFPLSEARLADENSRSAESESWTVVFPTRVSFLTDTGVAKVNLLDQTVGYLTVLRQSPELPRLLASAPTLFSHCPPSTPDDERRNLTTSALVASFYEASLTLLYHTFTAFPHELGKISQLSGTNVLELLVSLVFDTLRSPEYSRAYPLRLVYDLLCRFNGAVANLEAPASLLLNHDLFRRIGTHQPMSTSIAMDQLLLYVSLYNADDSEKVLPSRLLLSLVYVEHGVLSSPLDGLAFFTFYIRQVFEVLMADMPSWPATAAPLAAAAATGIIPGSLDVTKAVGNTYRLLPVVSPELTVALITKLSDGVAGLLRALDRGLIVLCGSPVTVLLNMSLQLLAEVIRLSGCTGLVASLVLPAIPAFNDNHPVPVSYFLLAAVFQVGGRLAEAMVPAAQILCAAVSTEGVSLFPALRSHLAKPLRFGLAASLHQLLRTDVGTEENAVRLQLLRVLSYEDPATVQLFAGPESLPANHEAKELSDLIIAKVLSQTVLAGAASTSGEKAAALHILIALGLTEAVSVSRVLSLLSDATQSLPQLEQPHEAVALAAAASTFVNTALVEQTNARQEEWSRGGSRTEPPTPRMSSSGARGVGGGRASNVANVTPLLLGSCGVFGSNSTLNTEAIDAVLRRGSECLLAAAEFYEDVTTSDLLYFPDRSVQLSREAALAVQEDLTVLGNGGVVALGAYGEEEEEMLAKAALIPLSAPAADTIQNRSMATASQNSAPMRGLATLRRLAASMKASQASRSAVYHTDALPDVTADVGVRQHFLFPLVPGALYRFRPLNAADADEVVTATHNTLVSVLVAIEELSAAMEASLWLSGSDGERSALFLNRSSAVLHAAVRCTLIAKPSAASLAPSLWVSVQHSLSLAGAAAFAISSAGSLHTREMSITGGVGSGAGGLPTAEVDVGTDSRRGLRHLVSFLKANSGALPIVNGCLSTFAALPSTVAELAASEGVFRLVLQVLQSLKEVPATAEALAEEMLFMKNVTTVFASFEPNSCPTDVLSFLLPAVLRRAKALSHGIVANEAEGALSSYFCQCLQCIRSALLHAHDITGVSSFLPSGEVVGLADALGRFSCSVATGEGTGKVNRRQSWHVAWCAVLELLVAVLAGSGAESAHTAKESTWLQAVGTVVPLLPRFLLALGGFTDIPEATRVYYLWDVQEMALCTELVALVSALGFPLLSVLPHVQRSFLHIRHFRLLRSCIATNSLPDTAVGEARMIESTLVLMARNQLSFFLVQTPHGVPLSVLAREDGPLTLSRRHELVGSYSLSGPVLGFDVLRRFIVQELHAIRQANLDGIMGVSGTMSGRSSAAPPTPSRDTSVPQTPSRHPDYDMVTEEDNVTLADALTAREVANHRALHVDLARLALGLFTASAEEIVRQEQQLSGPIPSHASLRELRVNAEKLLQVLDSVKRDIRRMDSPKLTAMVLMMRERLKTVSSALC